MTWILVADDEQDIVWALQHALSDEGYEVATARDGASALQQAQVRRPDLIIMDVNMPGMSGIEACHRMRRIPTLAAVPVLLLTVRDAVEDRVRGLDEGADDYMPKPFDLDELKARVRALLRRAIPPGALPAQLPDDLQRLTVGPITLDRESHRVFVGEEEVELTPIEFELLGLFMEHPGRIFSADELVRHVWGDEAHSDGRRLVRWHIKNLRDKIEPDPATPTFVRTRHHHGYYLAAEDSA